jgi:hypothetical protein
MAKRISKADIDLIGEVGGQADKPKKKPSKKMVAKSSTEVMETKKTVATLKSTAGKLSAKK